MFGVFRIGEQIVDRPKTLGGVMLFTMLCSLLGGLLMIVLFIGYKHFSRRKALGKR
jgi:hypothetical protein